ncbi:BQ2448_7470 [Microbotryum intermedium]|uniref:BQ2448_7470 protein n=1 Tax=Microbotryum intermedium TaxID=269621 RepID=A0A238FNT6_9BASI|nr:BQ2448_7470 [Microbotryum intermedium]
MMAKSPLDLPPELLHHCLVFADPVDVVHFGTTCRAAYGHVSGSAALWKACFLAMFDPPAVTRTTTATIDATGSAASPGPGGSSTESYDYRQALQDRIYARQVLHAYSPILDLRSTLAILSIATSRTPPASRTASHPDSNESSSANAEWLARHFDFDENVQDLNERRASRRRAREWYSDEQLERYPDLHPDAYEVDELLCHVEALATPSARSYADAEERTRARNIVYRETNFQKASHWGPFVADRSRTVDWSKVRALAVVMIANLTEAEAMGWGDHDRSQLPKGWNSTRPGPVAGIGAHGGDGKNYDGSVQQSRDWAGVEETEFRGTYAFLDYRTFEHFNPEYRSTLQDESEAIGDIMRLKLRLLPEGELPYAPDRNRRDVGTGFDEVHSGEMEGESDEDGSEDQDFDLEEEADESASESEGSARRSDVEDRSDDKQGEHEEEPSPPTSDIPGDAEPKSSSSSTSPPEAGSSTSASTSARRTSSLRNTQPLSFIGTSEPLHFNGTFISSHSHTQPQTQRSIRGTVSMTPDHEVHWQFIIRYSGQDQWLMNGVQVGGPKSRFGILGTWSTADHDPAGPCGPFWYFPHFEGEKNG